MEPETLIKCRVIERRSVRTIFVSDPSTVANHFIYDLWARHFRFVRVPPKVKWALFSFARSHSLRSLQAPPPDHERYRKAWSEYEGKLLIELNEEDHARGRQALRDLGIPGDAWYVCFHARESGFLSCSSTYAHRNADIATYIPAMRHVVSRGGYVVRMGDASMTPLPPINNVIDYAISPKKSDFIDIYLCHACRFFLGTNSGLIEVPRLFGRPCIQVNVTPFLHANPESIFIPKLLFSEEKGRLLTYAEMFSMGFGCAVKYTDDYRRVGIRVVDNSAEDIVDVIREFMDEMNDNRASVDPEIEKHRRAFTDLYISKGLSWAKPARIGRAFVTKHSALFDPAFSLECVDHE